MEWAWNGILQAAWTQLWQVTALGLCVYSFARIFARDRPHLAFMLWSLVLIKCVTPPLWSSPTGVFCWVQRRLPDATSVTTGPARLRIRDNDESPNPAKSAHPSANIVIRADSDAMPLADSRQDVILDTGREVRQNTANRTASPSAISTNTPTEPRVSSWLTRIGLAIWGFGLCLTIGIALLRLTHYRLHVRRLRQNNPPGYDEFMSQLTTRLKLRRNVGLVITASRFGPAVMGLFRPCIVLPEILVRGRSPAELEPILAHELIHIRRGDLWLGMVQIVSQACWWFHPLVWLANRLASREAERCCDEEVIGSTGCAPVRYAKCLIDILELRRSLTPVPVFPGVRPVEITSQRLERIMRLGQGCHSRTPWWSWVMILVLGATLLPGAGLVEGLKGEDVARDENVSPPVVAQTSKTPDVQGTIAQTADGSLPTNPSRAQNPEVRPTVYSKSYNVRDLVLVEVIEGRIESGNNAGGFKSVMVALESIANCITSSVAPKTWVIQEGTGAIEAFPTNLSLVISQTKVVHDQINHYLNERRKLNNLPLLPPPARLDEQLSQSRETTFELRIYNVADAVWPVANENRRRPSPGLPSFAMTVDDESFVNLIKECIRPDSWVSAGGQGTIEWNAADLALAISQTPDTHEKIKDALDELRRQAPVAKTIWTLSLKEAIQIALQNSRVVREAGIFVSKSVEDRESIMLNMNDDNLSANTAHAHVRNLLLDVECTYWDLWLAKQQLESARLARDEAQALWKLVHGTNKLPNQEEQEARELYFDFRKQVEAALGEIYECEARLRFLLGIAKSDEKLVWPNESNLMRVVAIPNDQEVVKSIIRKQSPELVTQMKRIAALEKEYYEAYSVSDVKDVSARKLKLQLIRERARLQDMELNAHHLLTSAVRELDTARANVSSCSAREQVAREEMKTTGALVAAGKITFDLAADAQRRWLQSRQEHAKQSAAVAKAAAAIHFRMGSLLEHHNVSLGPQRK